MFYTHVDRLFNVVGESGKLKELAGELRMIYQITPELMPGDKLGAILSFRLGPECHLSVTQLLRKRSCIPAAEALA